MGFTTRQKPKFLTKNMKKFQLLLAVGALSTFAMTQISAAEAGFVQNHIQVERHGRSFRGNKPFTTDVMSETNVAHKKVSADNKITPDISFANLPHYDYLEGPDGSTWFYTAEYDIETVEHSEYWVEDLIQAFTFTIYDNEFNVVGTVTDSIHLAPGETRAREVVLDPAVSAHFFNTDDNIEVMVFYAMNTDIFVNNYYYKVYSVGGEKDAYGNDVSLATIDGRCIDATNASTVPGEEDFYYTFVSDPVLNEDDISKYPSYVEYLNSRTYDLATFRKATDSTGPVEIFHKGIYATRIPGDTTDGVYFISKVIDGKLYLIYSQYEKPYFVDPTGGALDESATPDNSFVIEVFSTTGGEPSLVSTTKIPVEILSTSTQLIYSFYSIGSVAWSNDIDMTVNGTPDAPAFLVARDNANAATLEDFSSSYDLYANDGTLIKNLATDTESLVVFRNHDGEQPQVMFIKADQNGAYTFSFANLYSAETLFSIDQQNGDDPLTASCDRVRKADGSYMYVFELAEYFFTMDGKQYVRVAWFNDKGELDHIDNIDMGVNVQYATVNIAADVLNPYLYDDDDAMEYAILVKRTYGNTTRNEFVIVDDDGTPIITFSDDDRKGAPFLFTILPGETNRLMMVYNDYSNFNVDLYELPFSQKEDAVESVVTDPTDSADAVYYNLNGVRVRGNNLPAGLYIKVAGDTATKHLVK